ncbi:MAG: lipoprotein-releasing ABC transporter permease subunit [Pelagibacterales bacterium]|nr:lipoprotein-releasing ABC transporter permease subunit [Pelagibacterales bacterium]
MPFNYFERFVAFKYLKPLRSDGLLSIISWFSFIGIAIGVATLIIVMSVMNGFKVELQNRIIGFNGHLYINKLGENISDYQLDYENFDNINFIDPNITFQSLMISGKQNNGVLVKAINPKNLENYRLIYENLNSTKSEPLSCDCIILGDTMATKLGLSIGSNIKLYSTQTISTPFGSLPKSKEFEISGTFHSGMSEYDNNFTLISLKNGQQLTGYVDKVSIIEIHLVDPNNIKNTKLQLIKNYPLGEYVIRDWQEVNSTYFEALKVERTVMFIILSLIILIAAFNVVTSLFILVKNKTKEIAIMRTIGLSRSGIMRIFILIGSIVGISGTLVGTLCGYIITINLENIRSLLNNQFGLNLFPPQLYYIDQIPTNIQSTQILYIVFFSIIISILATIYPSYAASRLEIKGILKNA